VSDGGSRFPAWFPFVAMVLRLSNKRSANPVAELLRAFLEVDSTSERYMPVGP
jgi:hypothetical protein